MLSSDTKVTLQYQAKQRSVFVAYLLFFFLGSIGAHLLYLRRYFRWAFRLCVLIAGVAFLISGEKQAAIGCYVGLGILMFADLLTLWYQVDRANKKALNSLIKTENSNILKEDEIRRGVSPQISNSRS